MSKCTCQKAGEFLLPELVIVFSLFKSKHVCMSQMPLFKKNHIPANQERFCQEETKPNGAKTVPQSPVISASHSLFIWNIYILVKSPAWHYLFWCPLYVTKPPSSLLCSHQKKQNTFVLFWWKAVSASEHVTRRCFVLLCGAQDLILVKVDTSWCCKMDRYFVVNWSTWITWNSFEELEHHWGGGGGGGDEGETFF